MQYRPQNISLRPFSEYTVVIDVYANDTFVGALSAKSNGGFSMSLVRHAVTDYLSLPDVFNAVVAHLNTEEYLSFS